MHRPGLRDQRLQGRAGQALRHQPHRDRHHLLDRDRDARPVRGACSAPGSTATAPAPPCSPPPCFWSAGFLVGSLGIATEQLWLVYLGYGVIGGIGLGIGYISPVSTLIKWFPDRPGLATGMAIMGFGGGALDRLAAVAPADGLLRPRLRPDRHGLGASGSAVAAAVPHPGPGLPGLHAVRRVHRPGARPTTGSPTASTRRRSSRRRWSRRTTSPRGNAIKTPQFWLLWIVLFCNVTAGIGILEQAAPMIQDFFRDGTTLRRRRRPPPPASSACCRCSTWAAGSSGRRRRTTSAASRSTWSTSAAASSSTSSLATLGSTRDLDLRAHSPRIIISFYGGGFATVPAYLRDLFGTYQVGAIHGRLLTAWSAAGVAGPLIVNTRARHPGHPG